MKRRFI